MAGAGITKHILLLGLKWYNSLLSIDGVVCESENYYN